MIIGNPPYVQIQKFSKQKIQKDLELAGFETFTKTGDLYCLFYEKGIQLLKEGGILTFITSNKWMKAAYGEKTRNYFLKHNPALLVNLGPNIFEAATVDSNILLIKNEPFKNALQAVTLDSSGIATSQIEKFVDQNKITLKNLTVNPWSIGSDKEQELKLKIERIGKTLKNWDVKLYRGVLTGLTEAFVIDQKTKDELIVEDFRSSEIIKPLIRGRDITKYGFKFPGLYLLMTGFDLNIPKEYQAVYRHLLKYEEKAKKREDQGRDWYNLRSCGYYGEFEKDKIVWSDISTEPSFTFLPSGYYFNNTAYMISGTGSLNYLLAVLNSKVIKWFFPLVATDLGAGGSRYFKQFVELLPIPDIAQVNSSKISEIEGLVDAITKLKAKNPAAAIKDLELELNLLVYSLYDLSQDEINIIESQ